MVPRLCGLGLALAAAACYGLAVIMRAREARAIPRQHGARARLIVIVLVLAMRMLGEHAGLREALGVGGIAVGVTALALLGPERHPGASPRDTAVVVAVLCLTGLLPAMERFGETAAGLQLAAAAGLAFAAGALASKVAADGLASRTPWLASLGATLAALTAVVGVSAEMSAYRRLAAKAVAPVTFAIEIAVPVTLAPWLTQEEAGAAFTSASAAAGLAVVMAGVVLLTSGPTVSRIVVAIGGSDG